MFEIVNTVTRCVVASSNDKATIDLILAQIDTVPSSHEIVEIPVVEESPVVAE